MSALKILTVGSAAGSIRELFAKIKAIDAKHGKFDLVLCVGDFFGPPKDEGEAYSEDDEVIQLLEGKLEVPVECYVMQGEHPLPAPVIEKFAKTGSFLTKGVSLFHKSGIITTPQSLRVACLGGIYDSNLYAAAESAHGFTSPYFTSQTVEKLLSNSLTTSHPSDQNYTSLASIKATTSSSQLVDILISNAWPSDITRFSSAPLPSPELSSIGVEPVAEVVRRTKPRYHFAAGGGIPPKFWEREPFIWNEEGDRISRFVSVGAFGGQPTEGKKQRWFYAFSITPNSSTAPPPRPANATNNPLTEQAPRAPKRPLIEDEGTNYRWGDVKQPGKRSRIEPQGEPGKPPPGYKCKICESPEHFIMDCPDRAKPHEGYVCKICNESGHFVRDCPVKNAVGDTGGRKPKEGYVCRACGSELHYIQDCPVANQSGGGRHGGRGQRGPPKEIAPDECWFCLSNPNLAKHLIVSIGTECYVTLPKGQIVPTHTAADHPNAPAVPGGGHVLIVPITHYPTYSSIPPDLAAPIVQETERYKAALQAMFAKHKAAFVAFEVGRLSAKGGHAHVQIVPVPDKFKHSVEQAFLDEGQRLGIQFETDPDAALEACSGGRGSYFRVDLPDGRKMVHLMRDSVPFSIQFGREVLVSLLGMQDRFDWKACLQSEEEDKADVQAFKTAFAPFDPSL
ncbi:hypothetical protein POSPLADRAFT_1044935 [Postia placenta MAD-698-R-SB12]|uniref:CCHC-type domain-containing protein n=1 Tax=Postia placenta MAD-698-R-SB12 TaxID=670580 RepID=A0A1X6NAD9_9APHY|nr:hypothetical protein POSPLADRAFT_1044935 [Postia placenta MAD-698-R-SB12]OSX65607.1 hypothetical protein POSPLADRAFT_1044935 [Postia placenta MAD-698-R-SB12]